MLYIYLLGHLRIFHGKNPVDLRIRPKTLSLWMFLLLKRSNPIPRDSLAFMFWPDTSESSARADLRRHLHELERALPPPPDDQPWLKRQGDTIQWNSASANWLDAAEFERLSTLPDYLEKAEALYTDDLLVSMYDEWLHEDRAYLRGLYLQAVRQLIAHLQTRGDLVQARYYIQQALRRDPFDEPLVRALMRLQYLGGDRAGALKTYEEFQVRLSDELAAEPSHETNSLHETVVAEQPILLSQKAVTETIGIKHNLPATLTTFFGREEELADLHQMLAYPSSPLRLITLVGLPGIGKTRLALETGRRLLNRQSSTFPDGIYFVDLSALSDASLVLPAVAAALGIDETSGQPLAQQIREHLKLQYALVILDNFEQVMEAATELSGLLAAASRLQILVTSREPLKLYGEVEFPVSPLPYPDVGQLPDPELMLGFAAVALFEARARLRQHRFALTRENAAHVAGVCHQVDGIPLALELAAGQLRDLSVGDILTQLETRRLSLTSDLRDVPSRHQTLQAAIEWSYDLLSPDEQCLLQQLSAFSGGWTLEAAETVCDPVPDRAIADALTSLAEKNLIYQTAHNGGTRWVMLATIREFALMRLEATPDAVSVKLRHADYFAGFAERLAERWEGPEKAALIRQAAVEQDNIQTVLAWTLNGETGCGSEGQASLVDLGARMITGIEPYWTLKGRQPEITKWGQQALSHRKCLPLRLQMLLLMNVGGSYLATGSLTSAIDLYNESLTLAKQIEDDLYISKIFNNLGICAAMQGNLEEAAASFREVIAYVKAVSEEDAEVKSGDLLSGGYNNLALCLKYLGQYDEAAALLEEALAKDREQGDMEHVAAVLHNIGGLYVMQEKYAQALPYYLESLQIERGFDTKQQICNNFMMLAQVYLELGQYERSSKLYGFGHAMQREFNFGATEEDKQQFEHQLAALHERLGRAQAQALIGEGAAISLDEALDYALGIA